MQRAFLNGVLLLSLSGLAGGCAHGPTELIPGAFALPGGRLGGEEASTTSWSAAAGDDRILDLETRPGDPYSVRIGFILRDDRLYIDPASGRRWLPNLEANPSVRVRLGSRIYPALAVRVTDPAELQGFDSERRVFRLELDP